LIMVVTLSLDEGYGLVIGASVVTGLTLGYLGSRVDAARKKYSVPLPYMYTTPEADDADTTGKKRIFNRIQRGHQNALETYPQFLAFLLLGGLKHPYIAAAAGVAWCAGRILYQQAYQTAPENRYKTGGVLHLLSFLTVTGCTVSLALSLSRFL